MKSKCGGCKAPRVEDSLKGSAALIGALDEAARRGFGNGAFEELEEDVPAVVEEFFSEGESDPAAAPKASSDGLRGRLEAKVSQLPPQGAAA